MQPANRDWKGVPTDGDGLLPLELGGYIKAVYHKY
jgi:hypothetical protein